MWRLGAIRDGAAGLVKQGAGAVKQGVVAGAKLLENLDEVGSMREGTCVGLRCHTIFSLPTSGSNLDCPLLRPDVTAELCFSILSLCVPCLVIVVVLSTESA